MFQKLIIPLLTLLISLIVACTKDANNIDYGAISQEKGCNDSIPILINEFVATGSTLQNGFGTAEDWIEIYNNSDTIFVAKAGEWFVTDDTTRPNKYIMPDFTIEPRGFLIVFCDNLNRVANNIHTNFGLSASGEDIGIYYKPTGTSEFIQIDALKYTQQSSGVSQGRFPDGCNTWRFFTEPTPGQSNRK
jgi:hypothetical protein